MKIEDGKFRVAVKGTLGNKAKIARKLGCSWEGLYKWLNNNPWAQELLEEEENRLLDKAEDNLEKDLDNRSWDATKFVLTHKGYKRGYITPKVEANFIEKQNNVSVTNNNAPTYKFVLETPDDFGNEMEAQQETA